MADFIQVFPYPPILWAIQLALSIVIEWPSIKLDWNANVVEIVAALGTFFAVAVSVGVAFNEGRRARNSSNEAKGLRQKQEDEHNTRTASLVSAWVTDEFVPDPKTNAFKRVATLWLANDADEPVFDLGLNVLLGDPAYPVGPLAAPRRIPVLPPRKVRTWDLSIPLRAHVEAYVVSCNVEFSDARKYRWKRRTDGVLENITGQPVNVFDRESDPEMDKALGDLNSLENPMTVALAFLNILNASDDELTPEHDAVYEMLLAPEARGWVDTTLTDLRNTHAGGNLATYIHYPAPYISYLRVISDQSLAGKTVTGGSIMVDAFFLTLTFAPDHGWRVFGIGDPVAPDRIQLSPGIFDT